MKKHGSGCLGDSGNALVIKRIGQYVQLGTSLLQREPKVSELQERLKKGPNGA